MAGPACPGKCDASVCNVGRSERPWQCGPPCTCYRLSRTSVAGSPELKKVANVHSTRPFHSKKNTCKCTFWQASHEAQHTAQCSHVPLVHIRSAASVSKPFMNCPKKACLDIGQSPPSDHPSGRAPRSVVTRRSLPELLLVANSLAVATDDPVVLSADQNDDTLAAVALAGHLELLEKLVAR